MRILDVSMPISAGMPTFPGDPGVTVRPARQLAGGDPYNLSVWSFGSHAGTHVDPPLHFLPGGAPADQLDLAVLNGPCVVVVVDPARPRIGRDDVARVPVGATRVLFRTANSVRWARSEAFFGDYVALAPDAADALLDRGVKLVGIDSLSVESDPAEKYPVHHALLGAGTVILEGLRLDLAEPGPYNLRCLPLRLVGGDGAPCRAVLVAP
ncbi:MAG: cyclase family protein [Thermoplasmata archaeon]|nr:cyclase family protein [Thermoplasmata archaeon]